jgi:hypothetical protein
MSRRVIRLFFVLGLAVFSALISQAQYKQRNTRVELMSASYVGISNWGIISGGPNLAITQKVGKKVELGLYGGVTMGIQSPRFRLFLREDLDQDFIEQISKQTEFGLFSNIYLNRRTGSIAPIGTHVLLGAAYGSMQIDQVYRIRNTVDQVQFEDNKRIEKSTNDHIKLMLGLGKTTQFASHLTFRTMIAFVPYIRINEENNSLNFINLDERATQIDGISSSTPYSWFTVQLALGYQF